MLLEMRKEAQQDEEEIKRDITVKETYWRKWIIWMKTLGKLNKKMDKLAEIRGRIRKKCKSDSNKKIVENGK